jgi:RNA polymerase sigma factor (sigma-70 family)
VAAASRPHHRRVIGGALRLVHHRGQVSGEALEMVAKTCRKSGAARPDRKADWSALMALAQTGDRDAYRRLLEGVVPYLRSLVVRHRALSGEVEDTVQDILLTLHGVRHTYDPKRPFGPWLLAIARRRIVDRLRARGRVASVEIALDPEHETFAADEPNSYASSSDRRELLAAIESLPIRQRLAVRLLKLRELSLKEAAAESGMSVPALKVATHRAMKALRRALRRKD